MSLSHTKLNNYLNKPQATRFDLKDRDGMSARITKNGSITFQYRYRYKGRPFRLSIGRFPDLTLAQAREKIPQLRRLLQEGENPSVELKRLKEKTGATLDECISVFLERYVSKLRKRTQTLYKYSLTRHALGVFNFPVEDLTINEWYQFFDKIEDNHTHKTARDILVRLKTCMQFCKDRNIISSSTILMIAPKSVGKGSEVGDRVVTPQEIQKIWSALDRSKCYPTTKNVIKLSTLTAARLGEIRHMERCDVDLEQKIWTITKEKSKTNTKFVRPLSAEALKIIKWQIDTYGEFTRFVFPSGSYERAISPQTVNKLSRAIVKNISMEPWSCHDFRRSLSTFLSANKIDLWVTEKMLGHALVGILAIYNKHNWLEEQRDAYDLWENIVIGGAS